jgi:dipeptidyl aminopeptidase/acylaminoacyl peptidase
MPRISIGLLAFLGFAFSASAWPQDDPLPAGARARLGEVRYRNVGRVVALAFSPDGKTLVASAWDRSLRLWDPATGKELRTFENPSGYARLLAFAPDGRTFASGGNDAVIFLWETATGKVRRLEKHQGVVQALAFSPDGKTLVSRGVDSSIRFWDVSDEREVRRIDLPQGTPPAFAFSPDGKRLAYQAERNLITVRDVATGREAPRVGHRLNWFSSLSFSPDGRLLAGATFNRWAYIWDATSGKELRPLGGFQEVIQSLVFSPDGRSAATTGGDRFIRVWEMATRRERLRFRSPDAHPGMLAYAPDGRTLAQGSEDTSVILWNLTGLGEKGRLKPAELSPAELRTRWTDLERREAEVAYRAMLELAAAPRQSIPFLQEHLPPTALVDGRAVSRLVAELDSERFETRDEATRQLGRFRDLAESALLQALQSQPSLEKRRRIERLLEKVASNREEPPPDRLREARVLETLELMDPPAARPLLLRYSRGAPEADLTRGAKAALERLSKRSPPAP